MPETLHENEVIQLLLGLGAVIFVVANRKRLRDVPDYGLLRLAFYSVLLAWVATVAEEFVADRPGYHVINLIEHAFYTSSTVMLCVWALRRLREGDLCSSSS